MGWIDTGLFRCCCCYCGVRDVNAVRADEPVYQCCGWYSPYCCTAAT